MVQTEEKCHRQGNDGGDDRKMSVDVICGYSQVGQLLALADAHRKGRRRAQTYKRHRRTEEGIHSHIAVQLSLIGQSQSHGSKSGKTTYIGFS